MSSAKKKNSRVESLLRRMTLREKISQLVMLSGAMATTGAKTEAALERAIKAGECGSVLNVYGRASIEKLQKLALRHSRLQIPLLFGFDVIHGHRTLFPIPLAEACSWDLELMQKTAEAAASEATADGLHWAFAPMVDISRDPRWGRLGEGAGEDPWFASLVASARVMGFQGSDLRDPRSVSACVKHFVGYGAPQAGREYHRVDLSERELVETYLPPYYAAVKAGAASVMTAFNELNGIPATADAVMIDGLLRTHWKFDGIVISDYTSVDELMQHGLAATYAEAATLALQAGVDIDMQGMSYRTGLPLIAKRRRDLTARIDQAVRRVLQLKDELGLFDDPFREIGSPNSWDKPGAVKALAREAAQRSIVLLKNKKSLLPLKPSDKIALIGPLGNAKSDLLGEWQAGGGKARVTSVHAALMKRLGKKVAYSRGCSVSGGTNAGFKKALTVAKKAQKIVVVMGEDVTLSGEGRSRTDLNLPGRQRELLQELHALGKPIILVVLSGRPLTLDWETQHLDAILQAWQPGSEGGLAIVDVLFADYNPSAKLVQTFPRSVGQIPVHYSQKRTGRHFRPNFRYCTQYIDSPNEPLFPFGHGLSYSRFEYKNLRISKKRMRSNDILKVSVEVHNRGPHDGEEIVQLYIQDRVAEVARPEKELRGFEKIFLRSNESQQVTISLSADDLAYYDKALQLRTDSGEFKVWVGPSSQSGLEGVFRFVGD